MFILFELASGYALFERVATEEIGREVDQVQASMLDLATFGKAIKLKSFLPFKNAAEALQNINDVSEGVCNPMLKEFLEMNTLNAGKKMILGVAEKMLAGSIKAETGIECVSDEIVHEVSRGIRFHLAKLIKQLADGNVEKAQLGLGHSYSRAKVKFNVNRSDNMIIQAICMLDQLDKDVNLFCMRVREWYGWHFPELVKIVSDNHIYARLAQFIKNKSQLTEEHLKGIEEICGDEATAQAILDAARSSMGTDISEIDLLNIETFAARVISLVEYRKDLFAYLQNKMDHVAPNLSALIGETVGARLISQAGSLTNLSKYPASTVQILGAEKALFRALKTKGKTPKYGLIFHSSFIGRAGAKNKGRISRYLANKCSIASRIDCFTDAPTSKFGKALREQVEDRLKFFEDGGVVKKNEEVMRTVIQDLADEERELEVEEAKVEKVQVKGESLKRKGQDDEEKVESKKEKKHKKEKKDKKEKKKEDKLKDKKEKSKKSKKSKIIESAA